MNVLTILFCIIGYLIGAVIGIPLGFKLMEWIDEKFEERWWR